MTAVAPPRALGPTCRALSALGRRFYARGWVLGTSGNFSVVLDESPLRLAITSSGVHKRTVRECDLLEVDALGTAAGVPGGRPSAETLLHLEIVRRRGARAVLHTHSVWSTLLSDVHASRGGLHIEGYEMLKGLRDVGSHEHREWIPIIENDQDMTRLAPVLGGILERDPSVHAVLLRRHGMYTWGSSLAEAERHVEVLEFLFETIGRTATFSAQEARNGNAQDS